MGRDLSARRLAVIVTALPIERTAVADHLQNVREELVEGSVYRRGTFDERSEAWDIIVAEIGPGNVVASAEAERVISHYSPEVALFVGVAGAVKDLKHGDVIASTKVYGYESAKDTKDGFKIRPEVERTAYALEQRARYEAGEPNWRERIKGLDQSAQAGLPCATVAPIVAGEKVIASNRSSTYKFIRQHYNDAVAVEMEGRGFLLGVRMNHPTLGIVVRGISDLVNDKDAANDETWQPIAARHAAAFAFQILAKYPGSGKRTGDGAITAEIDPAWQEHHLKHAQATAGPRYSSELRVGTPLRDVFEALGSSEAWLESVRVRRRRVSRLIDSFLRGVKTTEAGGWGEPFPEHLRAAGHALEEPLLGIGRALAAIVDGLPGGTPAEVAAVAGTVLQGLRALHADLRADLKKRFGEHAADSASFRQLHAELQASFPLANADAAQELINDLEALETWGVSGPARASRSRALLLLGEAGVGKTHAICDIAHERYRRGLYTVVLFGEQFAGTEEPWERIRQLLGFELMSREKILEALDAAGASSGGPLFLCIDGLNESRPRSYWRSWLPSLTVQVVRYPNLRLCVSCRSTYEAIVVPGVQGLERIEHVGFAGMEFTACRHFFLHYGLEPPVAPGFHPEFSNPLFLRLACETLKAIGAPRMPSGWHGLRTTLHAFLREKNAAFAIECDRDKRERVPERALYEFMAEVQRTQRVYIRWSDAAVVVARRQPSDVAGSKILQWLVGAGLLITDMDPDDRSPEAEEIVRVAFERFGDHLLAERLLSGINREGLGTAIQSGALSFAFANAGAVRENQGLIEALSIQLPEHAELSTELVDVLQRGSVRDAVLRATVSALPWRDPGHMTATTQRLVLEGLTTKGYGDAVFDSLLAVAAQVTAPDALWLHSLLAKQTMPERDGFLCGYLHDRLGKSSAVARLLGASFEVASADVPDPMCIRWATLLLWFCVASDRRVRDRATKALVALTEARPAVWVTLIEEFASVDDEYVVERCFCAAYGALLRSRDPDAEREVAAATYDRVFADPTVLQNALIRDHARCIVELAQLDGVLPVHVDMERVRPPYVSSWPLVIPSEKALEQFAEKRAEYPKLYASCLGDDFFTYTLSALRPYEHTVSRTDMGRWILGHTISDMGYGGEQLASYDRHMLYEFGGGRGRPGWAERIGKKYQLIALSRLAARLADHVKPEDDPYSEPQGEETPLVYVRGRDIDPGLLARRELPRSEGAVWWLPVEYDFAAVAAQSNAEWTSTSVDVPPSERLLQPLPRAEGGEWQLLEGHPTWSVTPRDDDNDGFSAHRQVWMQIRGYLVECKSANRVFSWMAQQHFMERWMPEGVQYHEGYVGEYPWGGLFKRYPGGWHTQARNQELPAPLMPVSNSLSSSYEEDASEGRSISIQVPASVFFEREAQLRWDGLSGYRDRQRRLRFLDPSAAEPGHSALLVDRSYLLDFLRRHGLAILWTVLGEKIFVGGIGGASPRLEFSRAHLLDESGTLRSSELLVPAQADS
jgi:nucleoside phosphorylase